MKTFDVKIEIRPLEGVLDPQGKNMLSMLEKLGFKQVKSVTAGKLIKLKMDCADGKSAEEQARRMCSQLLANPVIETFSVKASPSGGRRGG